MLPIKGVRYISFHKWTTHSSTFIYLFIVYIICFNVSSVRILIQSFYFIKLVIFIIIYVIITPIDLLEYKQHNTWMKRFIFNNCLLKCHIQVRVFKMSWWKCVCCIIVRLWIKGSFLVLNSYNWGGLCKYIKQGTIIFTILYNYYNLC